MKKINILQITLTSILIIGTIFLSQSCTSKGKTVSEEIILTKSQLLDKIKGGWAGQTIGCTYGGPTEFRYNGTMIQDYIPINWPEGRIKWYFDNFPGLYDDIYMDLTFVEVFDNLGINAPVDSLAMAFANAEYMLWHANQAARYNILNGIMPPLSGHWLNNPHADDIDFQIEADFAGLMSPGMINTATEYCDEVGHIMNFGDGWYGGVYVAAMYSLAFTTDDIEFIANEALKTIPEQSEYYKCMKDIILWHKQFPDDWKRTWFECEKKWSSDIGCPDGVFVPFNIDAKINSAYVLIGLLYGDGDFYKTMDISTRCGADSDCNPATAAGILGTVLGYNGIPKMWMKNLHEVEDLNFAYTDISLNKCYNLSFEQALKVIEQKGGKMQGEIISIPYQAPQAVRYEKAFDGFFPVELRELRKKIIEVESFEFEGTGVVFKGNVRSSDENYVAEVAVYMNGELIETIKLPSLTRIRRHELFWKYQLPKRQYKVTFKWLNPSNDATITFRDVLIYSDAPNVNQIIQN